MLIPAYNSAAYRILCHLISRAVDHRVQLVAFVFTWLLVTNCSVADDAIWQVEASERIALIGNSTGERMSLFGNFETRLMMRHANKRPVVRNFCWPADEVGVRQRPGNYTTIDDPYRVFSPTTLVCFFGFNESFAGDSVEAIEQFKKQYEALLDEESRRIRADGNHPKFILVTPIAFEATGNPLQPDGVAENRRIEKYANAVCELANKLQLPVVRLFDETLRAFSESPGNQYTINGVHLNEAGDALVSKLMDKQLFGDEELPNAVEYERVREVVNDKSWLHLQDYRMLNGWYVYGGRRTWDTETFPGEFQKIRKMVAVRDQYLWDLCSGEAVAPEPDDSTTGETFIPETTFGSRDDGFRKMREPTTLIYPTPEDSISQMTVPDGFEVECFASEREFPELANPSQIAFDAKGRLWVSCMINYPQWLPGSARPSDRLLILEDTDQDGKADKCTTYYDELICPTGFEFYRDGVIVVDEPRILFLRDSDGDDRADEVTHLLDGIGTDDTHHAMGAFEYSSGGRLHMLEGIAMSTTLETPWGPRRQEGASGAYVWELETAKISHFKTPGQYNPWCLVFDRDGNGIIGDGTNSQQYWSSLLSGGEVETRASVDPIFDNEGIRPAAGNELIHSKNFPDVWQNRLVYACVINMHGLPAFEIRDSEEGAGLVGERVENLLDSTDMFFRPVDPKIGPDGALWFGDWCNALIGHMQYSQRDPNRDHEHGRIYRLVNRRLPLVEPVTQADASVSELLDQLKAFELRTRYRARRELRARDKDQVLNTVSQTLSETGDADWIRELIWIQESFHEVDRNALVRLSQSDSVRHRAAAVHTLGNEWARIDDPITILKVAASDPHPRVRLEALRTASLHPSRATFAVAASIAGSKMDKWISYTMDHTFQAMRDVWESEDETLLSELSPEAVSYFEAYKSALGMSVDIRQPLKTLVNVDADAGEQAKALQEIVAAPSGDAANGEKVFVRVCAACHQHGELGKKFGPDLSAIGHRMNKDHLVRSILWPNEEIAKGYETVMILDIDGNVTNGFVISENEQSITLGLAEAKQTTILKEEIEEREAVKASSMPEGLTATIAPQEFLDLLAFLSDGWIATNPNLDYVLQEKEAHIEVSRQTHVLLGQGFPAELNQEAVHLLSNEGLRQYTYAIHSPAQPSENPFVIIRFNQLTSVHAVDIYNRRDATLHDRAKGLTVWSSVDNENWERVFVSEEAYPEWGFNLKGKDVRYLKVGLERLGILHLDRIKIYGSLK